VDENVLVIGYLYFDHWRTNCKYFSNTMKIWSWEVLLTHIH